MSFNTIRENKILAKISEFTVYRFDFVDFNLNIFLLSFPSLNTLGMLGHE